MKQIAQKLNARYQTYQINLSSCVNLLSIRSKFTHLIVLMKIIHI